MLPLFPYARLCGALWCPTLPTFYTYRPLEPYVWLGH